MKKVLCLMLGMSAFAALAEDSYIYWMLSEDATSTDSAKLLEAGTYWARVVGFRENEAYVFNWNNTYLNMATTLDAVGSDWVQVGIGDSALNPGFIAYGAQASGWKYYVELYNDSAQLIYRSQDGDHPELYSRDSIAAIGSIAAPSSNMWLLLNMAPQSAPEPSSGLLMLLGCAALALRRRRQKAVRA